MIIEEAQKLRIWNKAIVVENYDSAKYRKDACGAWIRYSDYGDRTSPFGWEVDHICPVSYLESRGVSRDKIDDERNLRPFNWRNNSSKGENYPSYIASVKADENRNRLIDASFDVNVETQAMLKFFFNL